MEIQNEQVSQMTAQTGNHNKQQSIAEIQSWLVSYTAEILEIAPEKVNAKIGFDEYGMDSAMIVGIVGDLSDWIGRNLDASLTFDYPTIESLAKHLGRM
jgi:acyl carrier protein